MAVWAALKTPGPDKDAVGLFSDSLLLLLWYGALEARISGKAKKVL